jgi:hypothetical protein
MIRAHCCAITVAAFLLLIPLFTLPAASSPRDRFLVIASHTPEECLNVLDETKAKGVLGKFEWGCMAGDHTGYAIIEAKDEAAVKSMLPKDMQHAKVVKLNRFTAEQIQSFHDKK